MQLKNYLFEPFVIITLSVIIAILITIITFVIIRNIVRKKKPKDKQTEKYSFKKVKKLIVKNKLKHEICELHILSKFSELMEIEYLTGNIKLTYLSDDVAIAISKENFSLFLSEKSLKNLQKIAYKLGIRIRDINLHFELTKSPKNNTEVFQEITKIKDKNIIINFYINDENDNIVSFNKIIENDNFCKLSKESDYLDQLISFLTSRIINSSESSNIKYLSISIVNRMLLLLRNLYLEYKDLDINLYLSLLLNNKHKYISDSVNSNLEFKKPSLINILTSVFSLGFIIIFLLNIYNQLGINQKLNISNYSKKTSLEEFRDNLSFLESKVDRSLILSSIYPKKIKYREIYQAYANELVNQELLKKLRKVSSTSEMTAILVYFIYLKESKIDNNTYKIISIVSKLTDITEDDLLFTIKYYDHKKVFKLIADVNKIAEKFYSDVSNEPNLNNMDIITPYGKEYFSISSPERITAVYKAAELRLNKCTTQDLLSLEEISKSVPKGFSQVFSLYQNKTEKVKAICNSQTVEALTADISMINTYTSSMKITSFEEFQDSIFDLVKRLEIQKKSLKEGKSAKRFDKLFPILVKYAVNTIVTRTYKNKILPLIDNYDKNLYMGFKPNFYKKSVYISPIYSRENIKYKVIPLMKQFNELDDHLVKTYNVDMSFIVHLYKDSLNTYINDYIDSYVNLTKQLNKEMAVSDTSLNKSTLNFYLITMASDASQYNTFINYYKQNTSIKNKGFEKINNYFKADNDFLRSKEYQEYINLFSELKDLIVVNGYAEAYSKIKEGFEPLVKANSSLAKISSVKNNSLYILLKKHLDIAINNIERIAIDDAVKSLNNNVEAEYFYLNNFLPFNFNSDKFLSNSDLISYIGDSGSIYLPYKESLKPLLNYDKVNKIWFNANFKTTKEKILLKQFNKIYTLNRLLLNKDGSPKSLNLEVTPVPSKDYDYIYSSFFINDKNFVNSLNVTYTEPTSILYNWLVKDNVSIILKLDNGETIQKSYSGSWAFIKAIKDAKCSEDLCTWTLNNKGKDYSVSFKITTMLINTIKD